MSKNDDRDIDSPQTDRLRLLRARLESESNDSLKLLKDFTDNPICSVSVDESVPCIVIIWKQYATSTQLRFIHESVLGLLEKHRVTKILGDDTLLPTIHTEDQTWITENWMPRAMAAGLRFACSKTPDSHFGKISVRSVQSVAPRGLVVRAFENLNEAKSWLKGASAN